MNTRQITFMFAVACSLLSFFMNGCEQNEGQQEIASSADSGSSDDMFSIDKCGPLPESNCTCIMFSEPTESGSEDPNDPCNRQPGLLISAVFECPDCSGGDLSKYFIRITNFGNVRAEGTVIIRLFKNDSGRPVFRPEDTVGLNESGTVSVDVVLSPGERSPPVASPNISDNTAILLDTENIINCFDTVIGTIPSLGEASC